MMRAESMRAAYAGARSGDKPDIPSGKGYYHVNISLADSKSQVPVTNADVTVRVSDGMTTESHTLNIEYGEGSSKSSETIRVPANTTVSLGTAETDPLLLEGIDTKPGANLPMFFQSGDSDGVLFDVPVLDGSLDYYGDLLP